MDRKIIGGAAVIVIALCAAYYYVFNSPSEGDKSARTPSLSDVQSTSGPYKDGSYVGKSSDAFYGFIQVRATVAGGKLTHIEFLDYPQDQQNSIDINEHAMPILQQEAISAQSASVNGITGATDTVRAFQQSLSDALVQARA